MNLENKEEYENQTFKDLHLVTEMVKDKQFTNCTFTYCNFSETQFHNCIFICCTFDHCTCVKAAFPNSKFDEVIFISSKVTGIDWTTIRNFHTKMTFEKSILDYSVFTGLDLKDMSIKQSKARDVDFSDCDLTESDFSETDLGRSVFLRTNLTKANFTNAIQYYFSPKENRLNKTKFSFPDVPVILEEIGIEIQ